MGFGGRRRLAPAAGERGVERDAIARNRETVARYFLDLRTALRLSPSRVAALLQTSPDVIYALERGTLEDLPAWPQVERVIISYATMAGIDGRPVLALIAETLGPMARREPALEGPPQRLLAAPTGRGGAARLRGAAIAARRFPQEAFEGARARPHRVFYALSLPLFLMIVALNTSAMTRALTSMSDYFRAHFAEVREGHRWIEVSNPRSRRADKLQVAKR